MPLDPAFVGRAYPPTAPYEVSREKIREFAEAVGDAHPAYTDPAAARALGHDDVIAPPTFPFTIAHRAADQVVKDPELGLDYSRVVHSEQQFNYTRPLRAGDRVSVVTTVESVRSLGGSDTLGVRGDVIDADGEHVVTVRMRIVARGADRKR
ncbi:MaoC family dehydratase N-terminal domain-containing protein [Streptomyces syringium]|uniref:MaoC family dehydratase N-terminal domain-containing protein n=1 Tax=Streptomyces syringium TaxID=76729 RepID=UPI0033C41067